MPTRPQCKNSLTRSRRSNTLQPKKRLHLAIRQRSLAKDSKEVVAGQASLLVAVSNLLILVTVTRISYTLKGSCQTDTTPYFFYNLLVFYLVRAVTMASISACVMPCDKRYSVYAFFISVFARSDLSLISQ